MADQPNQPSQPSQPSQPNQPAQSSLPADKEFVIGKYKVKVDRHVCIGAASCVAISPSTFQLDQENKAIVLEKSTDSAETIMTAAESCPTKAIIITEVETGKQVWPS